MRKKVRMIGLLAAILGLLFMLSGCAGTEEAPMSEKKEDLNDGESAALSGNLHDQTITDISQLENGRIGVWNGSICEMVAREKLPDAEYVYYNTLTDMTTALTQDKIDTVSTAECYYAGVRDSVPQVMPLEEAIGSFDRCFIVRPDARGEQLLQQFNTFLAEFQSSGELDRCKEIWRGTDEDAKVIAYSDLTGENGTITLAVPADIPCLSYIKDGEVVGEEVDIAARFCAAWGYNLEIEILDFSALTPAVETGKCDMAASGFEYSAERAELVSFTDVIDQEPLILLVTDQEYSGREESFARKVADSFERTFIRENRWMMFVNGIGETLLITVLSIVFGTVLGFALYLFCRAGGMIADAISRFAVWLVQGMPMVVLLMIFYYIVFGNADVTGTLVAVICFTLSFGAGMFGMLKTGVGAIDRGQTEGARALGYNDRQTFYKVILPQATVHFLPAYKAEVVALIKATAVVGYIAVQDLTKASDIVRSRTYEAFFPLIATAVIYFVLAGILTAVVRRVQIRINPRHRTKERILKGIKGGEQL